MRPLHWGQNDKRYICIGQKLLMLNVCQPSVSWSNGFRQKDAEISRLPMGPSGVADQLIGDQMTINCVK